MKFSCCKEISTPEVMELSINGGKTMKVGEHGKQPSHATTTLKRHSLPALPRHLLNVNSFIIKYLCESIHHSLIDDISLGYIKDKLEDMGYALGKVASRSGPTHQTYITL